MKFKNARFIIEGGGAVLEVNKAGLVTDSETGRRNRLDVSKEEILEMVSKALDAYEVTPKYEFLK